MKAIDRMVQRIEAQSPAAVSAVLDRATRVIYNSALIAWPVDSGRSKASMSRSASSNSDGARVVISNDAADEEGPYAGTIRRPKAKGGALVWDALVVQPSHRARADIAEEMAEQLVRIARGA